MTVELFFVVASLVLICWSIWRGVRTRRAYLRMHNPYYGDWTVEKFFTELHQFIGPALYVPPAFILTCVLIANGGETEGNAWTAVFLATLTPFVLLNLIAMVYFALVQEIAEDRMRHPEDRRLPNGYHHIN